MGAAQLHNPNDFPREVRYLWHWFLELCFTGRTYVETEPLPLSNTELVSWCQLNRIEFQPWELRALRLLDTAWLAARREK